MSDFTQNMPVDLSDGSNNPITSQANGAQRALDVGIDVAGIQVDPRAIRSLTSADVITANQGTANTIANAWPEKITDGTNTAAVTAASALKVDASATTQPISGTVAVSNFPATQPVSGTVTANQGTANTLANGWPVEITDGTHKVNVSAAGAVQVDGSAVTQPVSGTVAVSNFPAVQPVSGTVTSNQGTTPWVSNIAQFGGSNISTGTGVSGAGIPRVTVSNDSNYSNSGSGSISTNGGTLVIPTNGAGSLVFNITGTFTGAVVIQGSTDGTNFIAVPVYNTATGQAVTDVVSAIGTLAVNTAGLKAVQAITAFFTGTANITWAATNGSMFMPIVNYQAFPLYTTSVGGTKATYSATFDGIPVPAAATDIFTISGSASKLVKVTSMQVTATRTLTAATQFLLVLRSSLNSGGTPVSAARIPFDSTNAAATAPVIGYTANPAALGTTVGVYYSVIQIINPGTTTDSMQTLNWTFGGGSTQPITLRGVNQLLAMNLNGQTVSGGVFDVNVTWTEE